MGPYLYFRVLIFTVLASCTQKISIQSARIQEWFQFKLLVNFDFTYAYTLIFIHRRFGSLFWLLGVLIGSLFHKKMGPYLKAWGSLLVLETVSSYGGLYIYISPYFQR